MSHHIEINVTKTEFNTKNNRKPQIGQPMMHTNSRKS